MKTRLKLASTIAIFLGSLAALSRFLHWMNQPSDLWLCAGALGALSLVVLVPGAVAAIWRPQLFEHKRP